MNQDIYDSVLEFRKKLNLPIGTKPQLLEPVDISFYARFIMEELSELMKAHEKGNLVDAADAVADLSYVVMGLSHHMCLPLPAILKVVHHANMQKEPGTTSRGYIQDAVKPSEWIGPEDDIALILFEHSKRRSEACTKTDGEILI